MIVLETSNIEPSKVKGYQEYRTKNLHSLLNHDLTSFTKYGAFGAIAYTTLEVEGETAYPIDVADAVQKPGEFQESILELEEKLLKGVNNTPCFVDQPIWVWNRPDGEQWIVLNQAILLAAQRLQQDVEARLAAATRLWGSKTKAEQWLEEEVETDQGLPFSFLVQEFSWPDKETVVEDWSRQFMASPWFASASPRIKSFFKGIMDSKATVSAKFARFATWMGEQKGIAECRKVVHGHIPVKDCSLLHSLSESDPERALEIYQILQHKGVNYKSALHFKEGNWFFLNAPNGELAQLEEDYGCKWRSGHRVQVVRISEDHPIAHVRDSVSQSHIPVKWEFLAPAPKFPVHTVVEVDIRGQVQLGRIEGYSHGQDKSKTKLAFNYTVFFPSLEKNLQIEEKRIQISDQPIFCEGDRVLIWQHSDEAYNGAFGTVKDQESESLYRVVEISDRCRVPEQEIEVSVGSLRLMSDAEWEEKHPPLGKSEYEVNNHLDHEPEVEDWQEEENEEDEDRAHNVVQFPSQPPVAPSLETVPAEQLVHALCKRIKKLSPELKEQLIQALMESDQDAQEG